MPGRDDAHPRRLAGDRVEKCAPELPPLQRGIVLPYARGAVRAARPEERLDIGTEVARGPGLVSAH